MILKRKAAAPTTAATTTSVPTQASTPVPFINPPAGSAAAAIPPAPATAAVAAPAPPPMNWKVSYAAEYVGPRLNDIDLSKTQGPNDDAPSYTEIDHDFRLGYKISKVNTLGIRLRAVSPFDLDQTFNLLNPRAYFSWSHMIETPDVDMSGKLEFEAPTTDASRNKGMIGRFNLTNNWVFKTSLRNWMFSVVTYLSPRFYTGTNSNTDLAIGLFPFITYDLSTDWQLVFDMSFDATHSNQAIFFDFASGDPNYINVGLNYQINAALSINPALRFYADDLSFTNANLYLAVSAAL